MQKVCFIQIIERYFHVTSRPPCWYTFNNRKVITLYCLVHQHRLPGICILCLWTSSKSILYKTILCTVIVTWRHDRHVGVLLKIILLFGTPTRLPCYLSVVSLGIEWKHSIAAKGLLVQSRFNDLWYNGITINNRLTSKSYSKMYGAEPGKTILPVLTKGTSLTERKIFPVIMIKSVSLTTGCANIVNIG